MAAKAFSNDNRTIPCMSRRVWLTIAFRAIVFASTTLDSVPFSCALCCSMCRAFRASP
jgi:hypothetical protein